MKLRKSLVGLGLAGAIAVSATPALAHECFIANRSAQGNAAVSANSQAWFTITPEILFGEFIGLTGDTLTCAVDAWKADPSLPPYIVVGGKQAQGSDGVIMGKNPNLATKAADGKGVDHAAEVYDPTIGAIIGACTAG